MDELLNDLKKIIDECWKHRQIVFAVTALVSAIGLVAISFLPDIYRSETRVYVDNSTMLGRSLEGLTLDTEGDQGEFINMARTMLLSQPNLERVINETKIGDSELATVNRQLLYQQIVMSAEVSSDSTGTRSRSPHDIISIAYQSPDPELAKQVVEILLDAFISSMAGSTQLDAESTERFLEQKLADYLVRLEASEEKLKDFKKENVGLLPEDGADYFSELQNIRSTLREASFTLQQNKSERDVLAQQLKELAEQHNGNGGMFAQSDKIAELEATLVELLLKYTESHPDVIATTNTLEQLKTGVQLESDHAQTFLGSNPVLEELRVELTRMDASIAAEESRISIYQSQLAELESKIDIIPDIEAEYVQLTRDYSFNKSQYETLLTRLEATRLSRERDLTESDVVIQVIDHPIQPILPVAPNRTQLVFLVFLAAMMAGVGSAYGLALMRPTYRTVAELRASFADFHVIGNVAKVGAASGARTRVYQGYALAFALLVALYVAYVLFFIVEF